MKYSELSEEELVAIIDDLAAAIRRGDFDDAEDIADDLEAETDEAAVGDDIDESIGDDVDDADEVDEAADEAAANEAARLGLENDDTENDEKADDVEKSEADLIAEYADDEDERRAFLDSLK